MRTTEFLKLQIYTHYKDATSVDSFRVEDWDEFLILKLPQELVATGISPQVQHMVDDVRRETGKYVIVVPEGLSIELYGIRVSEEDATPPGDGSVH